MEPGLTLPRRSSAPDPLQGIGPNHRDTWRDSPCEEALVASPLWLTHAGHVLPVRVCVRVYVCVRERVRLGNRKRDWERDFLETQEGSKSKINSTGRAKASRAHLFYRYSAGLWRVSATTPRLMPPPRSLTFTVGQTWKEQSGVAVPAVVMSHVNIQVWRSF